MTSTIANAIKNAFEEFIYIERIANADDALRKYRQYFWMMAGCYPCYKKHTFGEHDVGVRVLLRGLFFIMRAHNYCRVTNTVF